MSTESITVKVTARRDRAAVTAAWIAGMPSTPEGRAEYPASAQEWLQGVVDRACYSYRDQYRTDAITSGAFLLRFSESEMGGIRAAAQISPNLAAWLARIENIGSTNSPDRFVWLGSDEVEAGKSALIAAGLLTAERADVVFAYSIPTVPPLPPPT